MKAKSKKLFDAVKMVREIRDARYRQSVVPDFDPKEFERIKEKMVTFIGSTGKTKRAE